MQEFISNAGSLPPEIKVCPVREGSLQAEAKYAGNCLNDADASSVLLVTADFETRRALSIFEKCVPTHSWYVTETSEQASFGPRWWQHREWAKTTVLEWEELLWWKLLDRCLNEER
jgi:hypothetical protein